MPNRPSLRAGEARRDPEDNLWRYMLTDAYWFAGEREAAVRVLAHAVTRFGDHGLNKLSENADALALEDAGRDGGGGRRQGGARISLQGRARCPRRPRS